MQLNNNRILEFLVSPRYRWLQHVAFWVLMYTPHLLGLTGIMSGQPTPIKYIPVYLFIMGCDMAVVYFNLYFLIPRFFLKQQYIAYFLLTVVPVIFNAVMGSAIMDYTGSNGDSFMPEGQIVVESFVLTFNLLMTAVAFNIIKRYLISQARLKEMETTSLKAELAYLKHQINPHFLFNSLNNIYVQSRTNPTEASESILQLSDLLRYQLYDCAQENVSLTDEIEYLRNYLQLDKMRKSKAQIDFNVHGTATGIKVPPFLFIPFVENALKHGINLDNEARIHIDFDISPEQIIFEIENSKPKKPLPQTVKGGIGLANISRRLDLLYPGHYQLDIDNDDKRYKVRLFIEQTN